MVCVAICAASPAFALDTGDIVVTSLKGEVHVVMSGTERSVRAGGLLELPATIRTGADGAIGLRQGATTVDVGPDTLLEFPALESPGGPIDRIVQPRGNAFYSVGKREKRKLRIETPYLVGVVKGTQFNVVAQEGSTTISLFEGLLEIRSAVDEQVIDLHAGEIAARSRADTAINVLKMSGDAAPPAPRKPAASPAPAAPRSPSGAEGKGKPEPATESPHRAVDDADSLFVDRDASSSRAVIVAPATNVDVETPVLDVGSAVASAPDLGAPSISPPTVSIPVDTAAPVDTVSSVAPPVSLDMDLGAGAPPPGPAMPVNVGVVFDVNPPVDVPANVDLGSSAGNVSVGVSVGGSDTSLNVGLGLEDDNSGQGSSNSGGNGNGGNNGNSGQGNNGNGQGNDGVGPGDNGQGNNDKGVIDDAASVLDALRGKSGKK